LLRRRPAEEDEGGVTECSVGERLISRKVILYFYLCLQDGYLYFELRSHPPRAASPWPAEKNNFVFWGFGGEKVQKVQRSTKSSSMLFWPYFNSNNPPRLVIVNFLGD
jgi:hypothetical protein